MSDVTKDQTFLKNGGDSFKALKLMSDIENQIGLYDVSILESILRDTFSNTCSLIVKLLKESLSEPRNSIKRKEPFLGGNSVGGKVFISDFVQNSPMNITCTNCETNFLLTDNGALKPNYIAISRSSCYQYLSKETRRVDQSHSVVSSNPKDGEKHCKKLKLMWKYDTGKCVDASPLVVSSDLNDGTVYIGSHSHKFSAVDLSTGSCKWEITLGDRVESSACLSLCQQYVVVGKYMNLNLC